MTPVNSVDFRCRHVEADKPGQLLNQDTFYWVTLKGVGKVYVQVVVDAYCSLAFAKVYTSKMPTTACDLLYDRVLPVYEELGVDVEALLTKNGREFCGKPESHPYELLLALEGIEHRTTRVRTPQTNGFVERMNRTLLDECFRVEGRKTWYLEPAEIHRDLDAFLRYYNEERAHQGYLLRGRTPAQALPRGTRPRGSARLRARPGGDRDTRRCLKELRRRCRLSGNYETCTPSREEAADHPRRDGAG